MAARVRHHQADPVPDHVVHLPGDPVPLAEHRVPGPQLQRLLLVTPWAITAVGMSGVLWTSARIATVARRLLGVIKSLTLDGSSISDWGKYTTRTYQSPSGDFQVHYYMNRTNGAVNYGSDFKVVFNGSRR